MPEKRHLMGAACCDCLCTHSDVTQEQDAVSFSEVPIGLDALLEVTAILLCLTSDWFERQSRQVASIKYKLSGMIQGLISPNLRETAG